VAEDLGTWPPEQARVLLDALQQAGLSAKAKRTREGIQVTVEDAEADEAHRTLVANMDAIAQAARTQSQPRKRDRSRSPGAKQGAKSSPDRSLTSQRLGSLSRPLIILVVGLILASFAGPLRIPVIIFTIAALVYVLGKQSQDGDGGGPGLGRGRGP
jgi:hypothetical protein